MSEQTAYSKQFTSKVNLLLQNSGGKLYDCVQHMSCEGESAVQAEQIDEIPSRESEAPNSALKIDQVKHERPWLFPKFRECNPALNKQHTLRQAAMFNSSYQESVRKSLARHRDQIIIDSFFATVRKGKDAEKAVDFPSGAGYNTAAGGAGLTPEKVIEADRKMGDFDNDEGEKYVGITPRQNSEMASANYVNNRDHTDRRPVMDSGKVISFFGYLFKETTLFRSLQTGAVISLPMWTKMGMMFGTWQPANVDVAKRIDLTQQPVQFYGTHVIGAARTEEKRVHKIDCAV